MTLPDARKVIYPRGWSIVMVTGTVNDACCPERTEVLDAAGVAVSMASRGVKYS